MYRSRSSGAKSSKTHSSHSKRTSARTMPGPDSQHWQQYHGYDYSSYYAAWQNYHSQNPYYAYDQRYTGYGPGYQYPPTAHYPQYQQAPYPTAQVGDSSTQVLAAPQQQAAPQYYNYPPTYDAAEYVVEEHDVPIDQDKVNEQVMARSNDLYDAIENSRWLPVDGLDPPYGKGK